MAPAYGPPFPRARQGYDRSSVDGYLAELQRRLDQAEQVSADLGQQLEEQRTAQQELQSAYDRLRSAPVDDRAQDILDAAESRARALVAAAEQSREAAVWQARREAEVLMERARQEQAWRRRQLRDEVAELTRQQQALRDELRSLRALASQGTEGLEDVLHDLSFTDVVPARPVAAAEQPV